MKGTFFQKPMEYKVEIEGQTWPQGGSLKGRLEIRSHGEAVSDEPKMLLAYGLAKKVKAKDYTGFEVLETIQVKDGTFEIPLSTETPITDKNGSVYLMCGHGEDLDQMGVLALDITPHPLVLSFLERIKVEHRFSERFMKRKKDWTEVKMMPPGGSDFAKVDHVVLQLRVHNEVLEVQYTFSVQGLDLDSENISMVKAKKKFSQAYEPQDYQRGKYYNDEALISGINEVFLAI